MKLMEKVERLMEAEMARHKAEMAGLRLAKRAIGKMYRAGATDQDIETAFGEEDGNG